MSPLVDSLSCSSTSLAALSQFMFLFTYPLVALTVTLSMNYLIWKLFLRNSLSHTLLLYSSSSDIGHPTYHHFVGNTSSSIDVILQRNSSFVINQEQTVKVLCSKSDSRVDSKHDIILSSFILPSQPTQKNHDVNIKAPEITNTKHRIKWSESGIEAYREVISPTLNKLQEDWLNPPSPISFSVVLQATNEALTAASKATNSFIDLSKEPKLKKELIPLEIRQAANDRDKAHNHWVKIRDDDSATETAKAAAKLGFTNTRKKFRRLSRRQQSSSAILRDQQLDTIITNHPQTAFKKLRSLKSSASTKISELKVDDKVYTGENIADGFYDSMVTLKTIKPDVKNCTSCEPFLFDYELIRELSKAGDKIPLISPERAESLLHCLKPSVCDHFDISALHYIHAGPHGVKHFQFLLNSAIENIENTTCEEFNTAHACILYKGHLKDKTLAKSYRTISTCPFIAKALDFYIRELSHSDWAAAQADTQFLGANMSHELGALLLTETINHSLNDLNLPVFCLFLDAHSAFDLTVRQLLIRKLHSIGTTGQKLVYLDNRLKNRITFMECS